MAEIQEPGTEKIFISDKFVDVKSLNKDDVKVLKKYTEENKENVRDLFMPNDTVA